MTSSDSLFHTLPLHIQRIIDDAFDKTANPNDTTVAKQSETLLHHTNEISEPANPGGGGFLLETTEPSGGGFFVEEDAPTAQPKMTQLSLDLIPGALQRLDLPPDDEQVLAIFKNAASGWTSGSITSPGSSSVVDQYISRDDWRSVCAVLLEHMGGDDSDDNDNGPEEVSRSPGNMAEDEDAEQEDDYMGRKSGSSPSEGDGSSDEYMESNTPRRRTRTTQQRTNRRVSPSDRENSSSSQTLISRQKQTCLNTYALFFPDVPPSELAYQKLMIKDLQRVAKLLSENLKAEEMVEMLKTFSTSPDKSMNLDDFSRMMITAKLA
ncbi:hypothetical protein B0H34DRAFT_783083 [Crassisporium funariophilum]|nr:hypothetical protein B0H34DRAFT_783083 [Crassisporium funariophilum]